MLLLREPRVVEARVTSEEASAGGVCSASCFLAFSARRFTAEDTRSRKRLCSLVVVVQSFSSTLAVEVFP